MVECSVCGNKKVVGLVFVKPKNSNILGSQEAGLQEFRCEKHLRIDR